MPDINNPELSAEPMSDDLVVGEVDYNAPEPGAFPPQVPPGEYEMLFKLHPDAAFGVVKVQGKDYLQVIFNPVPLINGAEQPALTFQRASFYRSEKMPNSMAGDLIRALNIQTSGPLTRQTVKALFEEAENTGKHFRADVGWRFYCKLDDLTISTHPRRKKQETPWPRNADKSLVPQVKCPKCGKAGFGQCEIMQFRLPSATTNSPAPAAAEPTTGGLNV